MGKPRNIAVDIIRLRDEGKTYDQIKALLNCSKATISYHVGKNSNENARVKGQGYRKKVRQFIIDYKSATPCVDCGHKFKYYVMQFDHLPQFTKRFAIAKFHTYTHNLTEVINEIKKCDLVCSNCHSERTHQRRLEKAKTKKDFLDLLEYGLE
jgi:hypothetical protein